MTKLKAFIYCRVLDCKRKDVLYYQQEVLTKKLLRTEMLFALECWLLEKHLILIFMK